MTVPTITALPAAPVRSDAPADFSTKADAFAAALPGFVTQANAQATFTDQRATAAVNSAASASASASTATTKASAASTSASSAAASASTATTKASAASTSASSAAASASTATTKAAEASGSAAGASGSAAAAAKDAANVAAGLASIAGGPVASINGKTGVVKLSAADVGALPASTSLSNFASKTEPTGDVVGTTDTQTLTQKTLDGVTLTGIIYVNGAVLLKPMVVFSTQIYCSTANYFTKTVSSNITFSFLPPLPGCYSFTLEVRHTAGAITWPNSVRWPMNTAPVLTTGKTHLFRFITDNYGMTWLGECLPNYTN